MYMNKDKSCFINLDKVNEDSITLVIGKKLRYVQKESYVLWVFESKLKDTLVDGRKAKLITISKIYDHNCLVKFTRK